MQLYAVRTLDQEPVGFFFVRDLAELWHKIDVITSAEDCECREVTGSQADGCVGRADGKRLR